MSIMKDSSDFLVVLREEPGLYAGDLHFIRKHPFDCENPTSTLRGINRAGLCRLRDALSEIINESQLED